MSSPKLSTSGCGSCMTRDHSMTIFPFPAGNYPVRTESDISVLSDRKLPKNKKGPAKPIAKRVYEMVEMRGVEPHVFTPLEALKQGLFCFL